jgi:hypothetical protein
LITPLFVVVVDVSISHFSFFLLFVKPVLLIELNVNDALPPRSPETHKCIEGLLRQAHMAHAAYTHHHDHHHASRNDMNNIKSSSKTHKTYQSRPSLAVVFVEAPRMADSSADQLVASTKKMKRHKHVIDNRNKKKKKHYGRGGRCSLMTTASSSSSSLDDDGDEKGEKEEQKKRRRKKKKKAENDNQYDPVFAYPPSLEDVVLGAEFQHAQVSQKWADWVLLLLGYLCQI